jgi:hypothetical protein
MKFDAAKLSYAFIKMPLEFVKFLKAIHPFPDIGHYTNKQSLFKLSRSFIVDCVHNSLQSWLAFSKQSSEERIDLAFLNWKIINLARNDVTAFVGWNGKASLRGG